MNEQREIKFRVWSKMQRKFIDMKEPSFLLAPSSQFWLVTKQGPYKVPNNLGFIIQQFTGLRDKNNKEIYEGDICKLSFYEYPEQPRERLINNIIGKVIFDHYFLRFCLDDNKNDDCQDLKNLRYGNTRIEIIGNIFENPELLK